MKKIISTDKAPKAIGPYSQAVISQKSGLIFTAMQIGLHPSNGELAGNDILSQAGQAFENLRNVLSSAGSNFANVIKVTLYLANIEDFAKVNNLYSEYFNIDYPARSAVEVSNLPRGALIGIEMIAE